jgi:hypothetical protein
MMMMMMMIIVEKIKDVKRYTNKSFICDSGQVMESKHTTHCSKERVCTVFGVCLLSLNGIILKLSRAASNIDAPVVCIFLNGNIQLRPLMHIFCNYLA